MALIKPVLDFNIDTLIYELIGLDGESQDFYHLDVALELFCDLTKLYYSNFDLSVEFNMEASNNV